METITSNSDEKDILKNREITNALTPPMGRTDQRSPGTFFSLQNVPGEMYAYMTPQAVINDAVNTESRIALVKATQRIAAVTPGTFHPVHPARHEFQYDADVDCYLIAVFIDPGDIAALGDDSWGLVTGRRYSEIRARNPVRFRRGASTILINNSSHDICVLLHGAIHTSSRVPSMSACMFKVRDIEISIDQDDE